MFEFYIDKFEYSNMEFQIGKINHAFLSNSQKNEHIEKKQRFIKLNFHKFCIKIIFIEYVYKKKRKRTSIFYLKFFLTHSII